MIGQRTINGDRAYHLPLMRHRCIKDALDAAELERAFIKERRATTMLTRDDPLIIAAIAVAMIAIGLALL